MTIQRLNKFIAACGVSSRRKADELIQQGRVVVNGRVVTEMGVQVDTKRDVVQVDNVLVAIAEPKAYLMLHKPVGVLSTSHDDRGRRTVIDLLQGVDERVYPVGRLDYESEGLTLLTNDGALALRLTHPRYGVSKAYRVWVEGVPAEPVLAQLSRGIVLKDGPTRPARVHLRRSVAGVSELEFELKEGRNRQIRRMCDAVGLVVVRLLRIKLGPLSLGELEAGKWRHLTSAEVDALKRGTRLHG